MNQILSKFSLSFLLVLTSLTICFTQTDLSSTQQTIKKYEEDRDSTSIATALNLSQSVTGYYWNTYHYLFAEQQDQLDQLIGLGQLPLNPPSPLSPAPKTIIKEHFASKGRIAAKITEIDAVSKFTKTADKSLKTPLQLFSAWDLRNYHTSLLNQYAVNNAFSDASHKPLKPLYDRALTEIETELQVRGLFNSKTLNAELSSKRFELIIELNRSAQKEALFFTDRSPLIFEERKRMAELTEQVQKIDEKMGVAKDQLPKTRDLITGLTVESRLNILIHGKNALEKTYHFTRHHDDIQKIHIDKINQQISQERKYLYRVKNHNVVINGMKLRGPPDDLLPLNFEDSPFPKKPSPGDITLDRFLKESDIAKIETNKQKAFDKVIQRNVEVFKALGIEIPQWRGVNESVVKNSRNINFDSPFSLLKNYATRYYETLPIDAVEAAMYKAEFEVIERNLSLNTEGGQKLKMSDVISNDPVKLTEIEQTLVNTIKAYEKRIDGKGNFTEPYLKTEINRLTAEKDNIVAVKKSYQLRPSLENGQYFNRPPPIVEEWFVQNEIDPNAFDEEILRKINNEKFVKEVLISKQALLESHIAQKGLGSSPSAELKLGQIKGILNTNEVCIVLKSYNDYVREGAALIKNFEFLTITDNLGTELSPEDIIPLKRSEQKLFTQIDDAFAKTKNVEVRSQLSTDLFEDLAKTHKLLKNGKKEVIIENERWHPNQKNLRKIKAMMSAKDPGGIWLSPKGIELLSKHKPIKLQWRYNTDILDEEDIDDSWDYDQEWLLGLESEGKIYFSENNINSSTNHWINQIETW